MMVYALAGVGKSTTMGWALTKTPKKIKLSEEQERIVDAIRMERVRTKAILVFNVKAAEDLKTKVGDSDVSTATFHSTGRQCLADNNMLGEFDEDRTPKILYDVCGIDMREHSKVAYPAKYLISKSKELGVGQWDGTTLNVSSDELDELACRFGIEINDSVKHEVYSIVPKVLTESLRNHDSHDYGDMIWKTVTLGAFSKPYDTLVVDEAQDMNPIRRRFALAMGKRLIVVGDPHQAIYAWNGADGNSMDLFAEALKERSDGRGVENFPLTVTRRCGKLIVENARKWVPEFKYHESNPEGRVHTWSQFDAMGWKKELEKLATKSNMVLCRNNAPLLSLAMACIRNNIPAQISGKEIGASLANFVNSLRARDMGDLATKLGRWEDKERLRISNKRWGSEALLEALNDKVKCIEVMMKTKSTPDKVAQGFRDIFTEDGRGVRLSTIHKAKGLEADIIHHYRSDLCPHPKIMMKDPAHQEHNLAWVADTRAIHELCYVPQFEKGAEKATMDVAGDIGEEEQSTQVAEA
jgi:superfamily I DNA/RNA helicase